MTGFFHLVKSEKVFKVLPCCSMYQYFSPFYFRIIFHCIYHILFIHSSIDGQFFLFLVFFGLFRPAPVAHGGSQTRGLIGAASASLRHSHSNARSLTPWVRPGIKPATSWFLVRFINHWAATGTPMMDILVVSAFASCYALPYKFLSGCMFLFPCVYIEE